nr:CoA pyrophosphatase [Pseudoflavonifractor sp. 524-17]
MSSRAPGFQGIRGEYGLLVPLVEGPAGLSLLFEVRAAALRRQPGEVCFPGGRMEPGETPADCALRETWEELGIPPGEVEEIVPLDRLLHQSGDLMHPILGQVKTREFRLNPNEVEAVFQAPLSFFLETEPLCPVCVLEPRVAEDFPYSEIGFPKGYPWRGGQVDVPIYQWEGRAIWGLTGRIVRGLAEALRNG